MTPKERMLAALNCQQPDDEVPFWELEFHLYDEIFHKEPVLGFEFNKLSEKEKENAICFNADFLIEVAETLGYCAIRGIPGYWEVGPNDPAYLWIGDEKYRLMLMRELRKRAGDRFLLIGDAAGLYSIPDGDHMWDFVDDMYERPDEMKQRAEQMVNGAIEKGYKMLDAGAECLLNCSDFAFNSGPFMSPTQFGEFVAPYMKRLVQTFKKEGIPMIQHSDGNLMLILDQIMDSGVNAIQCVDPLAGMDIIQLHKDLGDKLCLIGNIDCSLLQLGTPEQIDASVKQVVEGCKDGGGFVLSGCNVIFKGIPAENYLAMVEARKKYGKYA